MKTRLFIFILVICVAFSATVYAGFYPDTERAGLTFSEMAEYDIDCEKILGLLETAEDYLDSKKPLGSVFEKLEEALSLTEDIDPVTKTDIQYVLAAIDNSEDNNAEYLKLVDYNISIQNVYGNILKKIAEDAGYKEEFLKAFDMPESEFNELLDNLPTDREFELQKELNTLTEEYYNNQFGTLVVQKDGKKYDYAGLLGSISELSLDDVLDYYNRSAKILIPLFIDMVKVRNALAAEAGYNDFSEYAYKEEYPKDYTKEDIKALARYTKDYIIPLNNRLESIYLGIYANEKMKEPELSEKEVLELIRASLNRINPELTEAFDYMLSYELYDVGFGGNKKNGAFTTAFECFGSPFLFVNPDNSVSDMIDSVIHEYGHFNAMFHAPETTNPLYEPEYKVSLNLDVAEIHSQGMEMLFMDEMGRFHGNDAGGVRIERIIYMLQAIIQGVLFDTWQERVYALEDDELTADNINGLFIECCREFNMEEVMLYPESQGNEWIIVTHNFEVPFYYISYAVSAVTALEIFSDTEEDRKSAVDKYMTFTSRGTQVFFKNTLELCGYSDIFDEQVYIDIANAVENYTGLGYKDVLYSQWYYPYIIRIANFTEPVSEGRYCPSDYATRLMFVETLGRMEEDVNGMMQIPSPFSDTDSKYVAWAEEEGIVEGVGNDLFGAEQTVTREQILCFLYRMAGEPEVEGTLEFEDSSDVSQWAKKAVLWAQEEGIASGYTDNTIRPKNNITRAEAAKFLADAYKTYY